MTAAAYGAGAGVAAALIYAIVVQWRLHKSAVALERARGLLRDAGERHRLVRDELEQSRERWRRQVAVLESEVAELETYITESCVEPGGTVVADSARFFASVQSLRSRLRSIAARDATVRGDATPAAGSGGPGATGQAVRSAVPAADSPARPVGEIDLGRLWPLGGGKRK